MQKNYFMDMYNILYRSTLLKSLAVMLLAIIIVLSVMLISGVVIFSTVIGNAIFAVWLFDLDPANSAELGWSSVGTVDPIIIFALIVAEVLIAVYVAQVSRNVKFYIDEKI
ncbi:hypothetical protein SAMN04488118_11715 [Epibacterium ulvae]|uniref:Uncharacterized protein n=1 Tax=Epibacterium ulvae TaxID=1156985 RepID=A0A1G5RJ34_9RHOB|nr:hypothetical protein [Epibacterium ulvae]SCZ73391.1 hypothetical protein SAMN04488118_11715 [Epibacterium ulvae]